MMLMLQGNLMAITSTHVGIAAQTGLLAVAPALGITFTRQAHHLANRWVTSVLLGACTFMADAAIHGSHYPGAYTEAALTGIGAFLLSMVVSVTPLGKRLDRLAESFRLEAHSGR